MRALLAGRFLNSGSNPLPRQSLQVKNPLPPQTGQVS